MTKNICNLVVTANIASIIMINGYSLRQDILYILTIEQFTLLNNSNTNTAMDKIWRQHKPDN